jgi:hypothetical protein
MMKTEKEFELAKQQLSKLIELYNTQLSELKAKGLLEDLAKLPMRQP